MTHCFLACCSQGLSAHMQVNPRPLTCIGRFLPETEWSPKRLTHVPGRMGWLGFLLSQCKEIQISVSLPMCGGLSEEEMLPKSIRRNRSRWIQILILRSCNQYGGGIPRHFQDRNTESRYQYLHQFGWPINSMVRPGQVSMIHSLLSVRPWDFSHVSIPLLLD